jgi:hypothetical protein
VKSAIGPECEPLTRFHVQIWWAVHTVLRSFSHADLDIADLYQEACILVARYSGTFSKSVGGDQRLTNWSGQASGDEVQIKKMLSYQLRIDLSQMIGRKLRKEVKTVSIDAANQVWNPTVIFTDILWDLQDGMCAWCNKPMQRYQTHVDHNHSCCESGIVCGECVRGLTHPWCNTKSIARADRRHRNDEALSPNQESYVLSRVSDRYPFLNESHDSGTALYPEPVTESLEDTVFLRGSIEQGERTWAELRAELRKGLD